MNATAVATRRETNGGDARDQALLKAIGLDKVPPEQRELALAIADRYALDLMLKHVVLIEGRPYITRDGLLHIAHRSGVFDGMEVSDPTVVDIPSRGQFWTARCSVWRKDMTRPFTYAGRYPTSGGNQRYAPEMAVKVSEVMALRRAFDVSAPVLEERWDLDMPAPEPVPTLREQIAERKATVITSGESPPPAAAVPDVTSSDDGAAAVIEPERCDGFSDELGRCRRETGHPGNHVGTDKQTFA